MKYKNQEKISVDLTSLKTKDILVNSAELVSVTKQGLIVRSKKVSFNIEKKDFSKLLTTPVELFLSQYEIPFYGTLKKFDLKRKDIIEITISFMENAPDYYKECAMDLLNFSIYGLKSY
ncbi:MAG: hypothetical protein OXC37_04270 [Bdellovibrionaceae bacterium]|nr:hypothetical protein [Pseudobdellovibrionaceae bacterium]